MVDWIIVPKDHPLNTCSHCHHLCKIKIMIKIKTKLNFASFDWAAVEKFDGPL